MNKAKLHSEPPAKVGRKVVAAANGHRIVLSFCDLCSEDAFPSLSSALSLWGREKRSHLRNGFISLLMGLALLVDAPFVQAQPTLGILQTNKQILFYWPSNYTDCALQSCTNLTAMNWLTATDAVRTVYGSQTAFTVSNITRARFFRLYQTNQTAILFGMVLIPGGTFTIGDTIDGESDAIPTNVTVSAFYMDTNLITYGQWKMVYNYATNHGYTFDDSNATGKTNNHPVQMVQWYDAVKWCNARTEMDGRVPAYYTDASQTVVYRAGDLNISNMCVNWSANGYRLPTEAEWEMAARGELSGMRFPWGNPTNTISWNQANYEGDPWTLDSSGFDFDHATAIGFDPAYATGQQPYTSPVGSFAPNNYGLFDMTGNVEEWCWDWYASQFPSYPAGSPYLGGSNPHGPDLGSHRVLRGAAWDDLAAYATCAYRNHSIYPGTEANDVGFRCVRIN
jgi:formylglycine-generating enzyme required for sulfatase activity